jgi:hypothetical protein
LYGKRFELPTGKRYLLGAGHIHFEVLFHRGTSWIEVELLVRIPTWEYIDVRAKNGLCQEKNGLPSISLQ